MARDHVLLDEYTRRLNLTRDAARVMMKIDGLPGDRISSGHWRKAWNALNAAGWPDPEQQTHG